MDIMDDSADLHIVARDILAHRKLDEKLLASEEQLALDLLNQWLEDHEIIAWG